MFKLNQNISSLSKTNLILLSIICALLFLLVSRISYAALTLSSTTVSSDGSLNSVSTGDFNFSTTVSNADTFRFTPATGGGGTFTGIFTSEDLTANRTHTFPNESGTIALAGAGGSLDQHCGDAPALTSGWGTGASISASSCDSQGVITFGNVGQASTNVLTFDTAFANIPSCVVNYGFVGGSGAAVAAFVTSTTTTTMTVSHFDYLLLSEGTPDPSINPRLYYQCSSKP